jgi:two-component system response regulator FixJ
MTSARLKNIFIVDDEDSVYKSVVRLLRGLNVQVTSFGSAKEYWTQPSTCQCHLLIADINMPKMDGIEFLKQVKVATPWVPVMMVTEFGSVPLAVETMQMGASDFVEKPLERDIFLASVEKLLKKSTSGDERLGKTLTKTEIRILPLILSGQSSRTIAQQLHRSVRTIELHRQHIMRKMGVKNIVELVQHINAMGLDMEGSSHAAEMTESVQNRQ